MTDRSPACRSPSAGTGRALLRRSTAIAALSAALLAAAPQARAQHVLDNAGAGTGVPAAVSGTWAAADPIWYDTKTATHTALPEGAAAHLANPSGDVTLAIDGTVRPGAIVTHEDGFTLSGGTIAAAAGGLVLSAEGGAHRLTVSSALEGDVTVASGVLDYRGNSTAPGSMTVTAGAALTSSGTTTGPVRSAGDVTLTGGVIDGRLTSTGSARLDGAVTGGVSNGAGGTLDLDPGTTLDTPELDNLGTVNLGGGGLTGDLANRAGGTVALGADTTIDGTLRNDVGGVLAVDGQPRRLTAGGFANDGTVAVQPGGHLTVDAVRADLGTGSRLDNGSVTFLGEVRNAGALGYSQEGAIGGALSNTGVVGFSTRIDAGGNAITNSGDLWLRNGPGGPADLHDVGSFGNTGRATVEAGSTLTAAGTENGAGGVLTVRGTLGGTLANRAGGSVALGPEGRLEGDVVNDGALSGSGVIAGALTNNGAASLAGTAGAVSNSGDLHTAGALTADSLANTGNVTVLSGDSLTVATAVENRGTADLSGRLAADLNNRAGAVAMLDGGTIAGTVANTGRIEGQGAIEGALVNAGIARLGGSVAGAITNSGALVTNGDLDAASLTNSGSARISAGSRLTLEGGLLNQGNATIAGTLAGRVVNAAGAAAQLTAGTISGPVVNRGTLTGQGTISGALDNLGSADLGGRAGAVANDGVLDTAGDLAAQSLVNRGIVRVGSGERLSVAAGLQNSERLRLQGTLAGGLHNAAGATALLGAGRVEGDVVNLGTLGGNGAITGALTNAGVARIAGRAGQVSNAGLLTARSTLSVAGLANTGRTVVGSGDRLVSGSAVVNTGALTLGGTLTGGLANERGGETLLAGGTISGPVTNAGLLTGRGQIAGAFANAGTARLAGSLGAVRNVGALTAEGRLTVASLQNDGTLSVGAGATLQSRGEVVSRGSLTVAGTLAATQLRIGRTGQAVMDGGTLAGAVSNDGTLSGSGTVRGKLVNAGRVGVEAGETLVLGRGIANRGALSVAGALRGAVSNEASGQLTLSGRIDGNVNNSGRIDGAGRISGLLINAGRLSVTGALGLGGLSNSGALGIGSGRELTVSGAARNDGSMTIAGRLTAPLLDNRSGTVALAGGTVAGRIENGGILAGAGRITAPVLNTGTMRLSGVIEGRLVNASAPALTGRVEVAAPEPGTGAAPAADPASLSTGGLVEVARGTALTVVDGTINQSGAEIRVLGRLESDLLNRGRYVQTGTLDGSLVTSGQAMLGGRVTGDVTLLAGVLDAADGLAIAGRLSLHGDAAIAAGRRITAGAALIGQDAELALAGRLDAPLTNRGTLRAVGDEARIGGAVANHGTIAMTDGRAGGRLTVGGLSGRGRIEMDIDTRDPAADRIVVEGGRATGHIHLSFRNLADSVGAGIGDRLTLLSVDRRFGAGNDLTYGFDGIPTASERIVYSVDQQPGGDLTLVSQVNPAIGAVFANVNLVQSLIGSIVNRPTSPYVTGLAVDAGDRPCGTGNWARMTGGHATVLGRTDNQVSSIQNRVTSDYYGVQGGADIACFDDRFGGWDMAFGVLGGINTGSTRQPIHAIDGRDSQATTGALSSITTTEFLQGYGGVYLTATKGRMQADLQLRAERTDFELANTPVGGGAGLGLDQDRFSSTGVTLSGSVSYSQPLGQSGWMLTPTAGFALSRLSTDSLRFTDGFRMRFDDTRRNVGFIGGTLNRAFVFQEENAALQSFVTATLYRDFASPATSILSNDSLPDFAPQRLTSQNLRSYGEISVGANYVKVLEGGTARKPRQLSTSARIDARFGDSIDSVGVTGQIRLQF